MRGEKSKKAMTIVCYTALLQTTIILLLQIFGIVDLFQMQPIIAVLAILQLVCGIVFIVIEMLKYRDSHLFLLMLAVIPIFISIAIDSINLAFSFMPRRLTMQYALAISFVLLVTQFYVFAKQENEKAAKLVSMEAELAESRIAVMLGQIQPHFLYNALGTY